MADETTDAKKDPAAPADGGKSADGPTNRGLIIGAALLVAAAAAGAVATGTSTTESASTADASSAVPAAPSGDAQAVLATARTIDFSKICRSGSGATVPTGSASEADDYYAALAQEIGLQQISTLDGVLVYLGYPLTAKRLQDAPPSELMDPAALQLPKPPAVGSVLATRFFAPKITDLGPTNTPAVSVGWRKIVRLVAGADSVARKNGIDSAFVLFNFFAPIKKSNPFDGADSANTQVMLISSRSGLSPIYWLDYDKTSEGAQLSKKLDAFFDAAHTPDTLGKRSYFVPCGCISCHGGLQLDSSVKPPAPTWEPDKPLLNYLDTDHWFDRVKPGEDFAGLTAPVIFDKGGFDVIRTLNREMRDQNARVQPGSVQHRAATHWSDLHATSADHVENLALRALPSTGNPTVQWSATDPSDVATLKSLNHFCFRCHGSVEFDVFDKSMMLSLRTPLLARLQPRGTLTDDRATMPPDRDMSTADRAALRGFITAH